MSATQRVRKPFLIGVAGGTASGKSTVCQKIMAKLGQDCQRRVALIKQDSFYRNLTPDELAQAKKGCFNFDHPDAVDDQAMYQALKDILNGVPVKLPIHDYHDNRPKEGEFYEVHSADVVLFEDSDTRLSRRVVRDVRERSRPLEVVLNQYDQFVKPAFEEFCQPTKKYADMIIPRGAENEVAIGLINHNVTYLLSSDIPALRNGHYRPMPFRAGTPPGSKDENSQQVESLSSDSAHNLPPGPKPPSRSNSGHLPPATSATTAVAQRSTDDFKEEQDTLQAAIIK